MILAFGVPMMAFTRPRPINVDKWSIEYISNKHKGLFDEGDLVWSIRPAVWPKEPDALIHSKQYKNVSGCFICRNPLLQPRILNGILHKAATPVNSPRPKTADRQSLQNEHDIQVPAGAASKGSYFMGLVKTTDCLKGERYDGSDKYPVSAAKAAPLSPPDVS